MICLTNRESPENRRNIALSLNDAGTRLVKKVNRRTAIARVLREMAANDRDLLATAFDRFATSAGEPVADDVVAKNAGSVTVVHRTPAATSRANTAEAALATGDLIAARHCADDVVTTTTGCHEMVALTTRARGDRRG
jgi:hypothetical protein